MPALEDFLTAEVLLEVYLRDAGVSAQQIGVILEHRDRLLRSLATERLYSLEAVAESLRQAATDDRDLEMALVGAARSLGVYRLPTWAGPVSRMA